MDSALVITIIGALVGQAGSLGIFLVVSRRKAEERERTQDQAIAALRNDLITRMAELQTKLTQIEARLEIEDRYRAERWDGVLLRIKSAVNEYCAQWFADHKNLEG